MNMNYGQCEDLYRQHIKYVVVTSTTGKRIQLAKNNLQKYISPAGLSGNFQLITDANNKMISINKISE